MLVAIAGLKGGVGKSSVSVLITTEALARGWTVTLADLDPQGTSSVWLGQGISVHLPRPTEGDLRALDSSDTLVVLDLPPGEAPGVAVGLAAADRVIAVTGPTWPDMRALVPLERLVDIDAVIVNRADIRRRLHRDAVERLASRYGDRLISAVPYRAEMEAAAAESRPPVRDSDVGAAGVQIVDHLAIWRRTATHGQPEDH